MAQQIFLYPTVVGLTGVSFEKIDIAIGTGTLTSAKFGIPAYGTIKAPTVTVDRVNKTVTYTTGPGADNTDFSGHAAGTSGALKGLQHNASYDQLTFDQSLTDWPSQLTSGSDAAPDQVLCGAVFAYMVIQIFDGGAGLITNLDVTTSANRTTGLFFVAPDPLSNMITDIDTKTAAAFNKQITFANEPDEYKYWNYRTAETTDPLETSSVSFSAVNSDKIYVKYSIVCSFSAASENIDETQLDAITSSGTQATPFSSADITVTFILGWTVIA
tara:strand:- start:4365 stop:5180 length:816 start_codon:yes stop_codon:yes gene_type:complete